MHVAADLWSICCAPGFPFYANHNILKKENKKVVTIINELAQQAAIIGIGLYYSTGDNGDDSEVDYEKDYDDVTSPNLPAADPYVTAVGGTTLALGFGGYTYIKEYGWGNDACNTSTVPPKCTFMGGGGGGVAHTFHTPRYQKNVAGAEAILKARGYREGRVSPDVAAAADPFAGYAV